MNKIKLDIQLFLHQVARVPIACSVQVLLCEKRKRPLFLKILWTIDLDVGLFKIFDVTRRYFARKSFFFSTTFSPHFFAFRSFFFPSLNFCREDLVQIYTRTELAGHSLYSGAGFTVAKKKETIRWSLSFQTKGHSSSSRTTWNEIEINAAFWLGYIEGAVGWAAKQRLEDRTQSFEQKFEPIRRDHSFI
jgi:hypothetical protein